MTSYSQIKRIGPEIEFPFSGRLIDGREAATWLFSELGDLPAGISICSAFLRSDALQMLFPPGSSLGGGRILTRWRLGDLLSRASDLEAYIVAKRLGFSFYVRQDFHGKVFAVPRRGVIVGSANVTLSGLALKESFNSEICTLVPYLEANSALINQIFDSSILITDALFDQISAVVQGASDTDPESAEWPNQLLDELRGPGFSGRLLVSECLTTVPVPVPNRQGLFYGLSDHDLQLLSIDEPKTHRTRLEHAFKMTRIYRWLIFTLKSNGGQAYFGFLAQSLHNTLLDDPVVYRRDVKTILQTVLQWCELLEGAGVIVDRPNYSQRIRLI